MAKEDDTKNQEVEVEIDDEDLDVDETEEEVEEDEEDSEGAEGDKDSAKNKSEDKTKAEVAGLKKALRASRAEARQARKEAAAAKAAAAQVDEKDKTEVEQVKSAMTAVETERDKFKDIAVRVTVAAALQEAGAVVSTKRLLKMMDLSDVEFNSKGELEGLEDAIDELREDFPDGFKKEDDEEDSTKRRPRARVGRVDAGTKTPAQKKMTTTQKMIQGTGVRFSR